MKRLLVISALVAALGAPVAVAAQPQPWQVAQAGRQVPLSRIIPMIAQREPGRHLNTTMGEQGGHPVYFVQWQTTDGRVVIFVVDAESGQIIGRRSGG
jgi:uncharacterized membrane protein YkoI